MSALKRLFGRVYLNIKEEMAEHARLMIRISVEMKALKISMDLFFCNVS